MGLAVVWSVFSGTCVQVAGLAPACSLECIKHKHVLQHVSHAVLFSRRIRLAMGNVSVCARLQSPNRRETADVHSDRKFPYAARSTCSHQPLGHHSARSAQAEKTPHLCIIWSLFSVAIGSTARATNSCISLLTQMPADKTEWELMVIRENQKALTVTISSALSRALTLQSGLPGLNTRIQLFNFLPPPLPVGSRKLGLQHLLVPGLQHPSRS